MSPPVSPAGNEERDRPVGARGDIVSNALRGRESALEKLDEMEAWADDNIAYWRDRALSAESRLVTLQLSGQRTPADALVPRSAHPQGGGAMSVTFSTDEQLALRQLFRAVFAFAHSEENSDDDGGGEFADFMALVGQMPEAQREAFLEKIKPDAVEP